LAYNTKEIKLDVNQKPIPQIYNPVTDEYEVLQGENGASRHIIYSTDGQPISTTGNKLAVRASEVETILNEIKSKDFATQTTLAAILAKIIAAPATEAKQDALAALIGEVDADPTANTLLARIKSLEDKIDAIIDGSAPAVTQLSGSIETVVDNPVTGIKTITATAAELFAGAYAKPNRRKLIIKNEDQSLRFRIGKADITQQNGFPVEPGAVVIIPFDPAVMVPIYAISEGASLQASVMEV
jgi:hypothetical protein